MILPKVRDPRFITIRRGGTLTDEDHHLLALWAAACAEHVLHLFEAAQSEDPRPRAAIERARAWARGEITMTQARTAGGHAMGAARDLRGPARHAAYAAGQAAVVAHVAAHDLGAAAYAIKAARAAAPTRDAESARHQECQWQRDQLPEEIADLVLDDQRLRNDICWNVFTDDIGSSSGRKHGTLVGVLDVLDGLDALGWAALETAFGPAGGVPVLVRQLVAEDAHSRADAVEELFGTVWHQGTVYECTQLVVPFLAAVVANPAGDDRTRAEVALMLVCIASATSFVLPGQPREMLQPGWLREPGEDTPSRDLTVECRAAVAACAAVLVSALPEAPPATRAALVATLAATTPGPGSATLTALRPFEDDPDPRLATAARATRLVADEALTHEDLAELSAVDAEAADYLSSIAEWPVLVRAVELARELAERVVAERLSEL